MLLPRKTGADLFPAIRIASDAYRPAAHVRWESVSTLPAMGS